MCTKYLTGSGNHMMNLNCGRYNLMYVCVNLYVFGDLDQISQIVCIFVSVVYITFLIIITSAMLQPKGGILWIQHPPSC